MSEAMAYSGTCDDCLASVTVYPHPEANEETVNLIAEGPDEREAFTSCYVCDGHISWNGSDPVRSVIANA